MINYITKFSTKFSELRYDKAVPKFSCTCSSSNFITAVLFSQEKGNCHKSHQTHLGEHLCSQKTEFFIKKIVFWLLILILLKFIHREEISFSFMKESFINTHFYLCNFQDTSLELQFIPECLQIKKKNIHEKDDKMVFHPNII